METGIWPRSRKISAISALNKAFRNIPWESIISSAKIFFGLVIILIMLSCAPRPPKPVTTPAVTELPAPFNLSAITESRKATIYWSIDRAKVLIISGYNIYLASESAVKDTASWKRNLGKPYNDSPYPGDTDSDISRESMPLENLVNGQKYFVMVRLVGSDGKESGSSNIAEFTPLASGEFIISSNHDASNGGFNFENEESVPGRDPRSDIYLYATEERTGLSSPSRLGAGLRKTAFIGMRGDAWVETNAIVRRQNLRIRTKDGVAQIRIEELIGKYPTISARISYTFHPDTPQ